MTNYTTAQLEAWAGLGPWRVGRSLCGYYPAIMKDIHLGHNTNITGAIHGYMYHADQKANQADNATLIAAAPDLARLVLEKDAEIARLKAVLKAVIDAHETGRFEPLQAAIEAANAALAKQEDAP